MTSENPFSFFDKIYCINRASRTDRWGKSLLEFQKLNLTVERFNAIEGGAKGCMLSHINIIRQARENRYRRVLVLEDDVEFLVTDLDYYYQVFKTIEFMHWHLLYLGANVNEKLKRKNEYLFTAKSTLCLHAVAYNETIFNQIIIDARTGKIERSKFIDSYLLGKVQSKQCSFITSQFCATQRPDYSDIENYPVNYSDIREKFQRMTS